VLVTASGGMAATVDAKTRKVTWSQNVGGNPHTMELLPTGAVVVASSKSGRLTAYGKGRHTGRSVAFPDAHAVVWNAASGRLWALGGTALCSYAVRATATAPKLTGKSCVRAPKAGHDLTQVQGSLSKLWFSSKSHVYQYDINSRRGVRAAGYIDNPKVKSIGNQPGGPVITTQVKAAKLRRHLGRWQRLAVQPERLVRRQPGPYRRCHLQGQAGGLGGPLTGGRHRRPSADMAHGWTYEGGPSGLLQLVRGLLVPVVAGLGWANVTFAVGLPPLEKPISDGRVTGCRVQTGTDARRPGSRRTSRRFPRRSAGHRGG